MSEARKPRVAVNGYGVIGKRVAAAVVQQEDMSLAGVSDVVTDWRAGMVTRNGFSYMVDNQAIVIPETIDAIRALTGTVRAANESIARTNAALGIDASLM